MTFFGKLLRRPYLYVFYIVLTLLPSARSAAETFDMFSDTDKLRDQTIIAAGNISRQMWLQPSNDDSFGTSDNRIYEMDQFCFKSNSGIPGDAGLLLLDKYKNASLAEFKSSISQITVKVKSITLLDCAAISRQQLDELSRQGQDLKQQLETQKEQIQMFIKQFQQQHQNR